MLLTLWTTALTVIVVWYVVRFHILLNAVDKLHGWSVETDRDLIELEGRVEATEDGLDELQRSGNRKEDGDGI